MTKRAPLTTTRPATQSDSRGTRGLGIDTVSKDSSLQPLRKPSVSSEPIVNIQEFERRNSEMEKVREREREKEKEKEKKEKEKGKEKGKEVSRPSSTKLGLDTSNLGPPLADSSWLMSATPQQPGSPPAATPTVTISRDGLADTAELLEEEEDEDKRMAQKIFDGDEEFVAKARAAAWLGEE
jgi:hypothetical protein